MGCLGLLLSLYLQQDALVTLPWPASILSGVKQLIQLLARTLLETGCLWAEVTYACQKMCQPKLVLCRKCGVRVVQQAAADEGYL